jgi:hypothetical protein
MISLYHYISANAGTPSTNEITANGITAFDSLDSSEVPFQRQTSNYSEGSGNAARTRFGGGGASKKPK